MCGQNFIIREKRFFSEFFGKIEIEISHVAHPVGFKIDCSVKFFEDLKEM